MNNSFFDLRDITVTGIVREIKKYLFIMVTLTAAVFLTVTSVGTLTYEPQYQSEATLAISVVGYSDYSALQIANNMADVFANVFDSSALQRKISEAAGEDVNGKITTNVVSETNLLTLTSTASDPRQAYLYLQMALENYDEVSGHVFSNAVLDIVEEPSVPITPSNTSPLIRYRWILTALAALLVAVWAVVQYLLRFTVKSVNGAKRLLDGEIVGVVAEEKSITSKDKKGKAKKTDVTIERNEELPIVITSSLTSLEFSERVRTIALQTERHMQQKHQKVLLVTSVIEHEGKSSFSTNIAVAMAERGKRVLLIDGDLRRPIVRKVFGQEKVKNCSLTDVVTKKVNWKDAIIRDKNTGVSVLYQMRAISEPEQYMDADLLKALFAEMKEDFDYIVIDTSPVSVSREAEVWMQMADTGLLVVRQDWSDVRAVNDAVDLIWQNSGDFAGFALNAFTDGSNADIQKGGSNGKRHNS